MRVLLLVLLLFSSTFAYNQIVVWTGATDNFWDEPTNWSTSSVPGPTDKVIIDGATVELQSYSLIESLIIKNSTLFSGVASLSLDVQGDSAYFENVIMTNVTSSFVTNVLQFLNSDVSDADLNATSLNIYLEGSTFLGVAAYNFVKNGNAANSCVGGNTFGDVSLQLDADTDWKFGTVNPDFFFNCSVYNLSNSGIVYLAEGSAGNTFQSSLLLNNGTALPAGTREIHFCDASGSTATINTDCFVNNNGSSGIFFGANGGQTTFSNTSNLFSFGFVDGTLSLANSTFEIGLNFNYMSGTASLVLGENSVFNQLVNGTSPRLFFNGSTFNNGCMLSKTGAGDDLSDGGNTFAAFTTNTISNSGTGHLVLGGTNPDLFHGTMYFYNYTADKQIRLAESSAGNVMDGPIHLDNGTALAPGTRSIHIARESAAELTISESVYLNNNGSTGIFFGENGGQSTFSNTAVIGSLGFVDGTLLFKNVISNTGLNIGFMSGTASLILGENSVFNQLVSGNPPRLFFNGSTFNNGCMLVKMGAGDDLSDGGNTFAAFTTNTISNFGTGDLVFGAINPDVFHGTMYFYNHTVDKQIRIAESSAGNVMDGPIHMDNGTALAPGTRSIHIARESAAALTISESVYLNNNGSTGIFFGENGGQSTFSNTAVIGSLGFVDGTLLFKNVISNTGLNIGFMSGTASLILGENSVFNQLVNGNPPRLFFNGSTFNNGCMLVKMGAGDDLSDGGNTFAAFTTNTISNFGTGDLVFGAINPDLFHGTMYFYNHTVDKQIRIAESSAGNVMDGPIHLDNGTALAPGTRSIHITRESGAALTVSESVYLNNNGSTGIFFGENGGQSTFSNTAVIGSLGFVDGTLLFKNVISNTGLNIGFMSGTASFILGENSVFNQLVNGNPPRLFFNGSTFNNGCMLVKMGAGDDLSDGGNTFAAFTTNTISNFGTGDLVFGAINPDLFHGTMYFYNHTLDKHIRIAESSAGNIMDGEMYLDNGTAIASGTRSIHITRETGSGLLVSTNIHVNNNGSTGIFFGENGGQTTFANSSVIASSGFVDGTLLFANSTHNHVSTLNFMSGTASLVLGPNTTYNNSITTYSPRLFLNGARFNSLGELHKTGASNDASIGGNLVDVTGNVILLNDGTGDMYLGTVNPDLVDGTFVLNPTSANDIYFAKSSSGNVVNGTLTCDIQLYGGSTTRSIHLATDAGSDLLINGTIGFNNNGSQGIYFGESGGTTTFDLNSFFASLGFVGGELEMQNVTCDKVATINFMTNGSSLIMGPNTTLNNTFDATAPSVFLNGITTNADVIFTKTGILNDVSVGGNTFNGIATLQNTGTGAFNLAGTSGDVFYGDIFVTTTSSGNIDLVHTAISSFQRNVIFNTNASVTSGTNGGYANFEGANSQAISNIGGNIPVFNNLRMNKSGNDLSLDCPVNIGVEADFITGRIFTTSTNYIQFLDDAVVEPNNISSNSFVHGPVRKVGNDFFAFPVGKGARYQAAAIDAPSSISDVFTGEYFDSNSDLLYTHGSRVPTLNNISTCDYWTIDRTTGTSNVAVWLSWNTPGCNGMTNLAEVVISRWDSGLAQWQDHGQANVNGNVNDGFMSTAAPVTSFSPFALASLTVNNPLPIELLSFDVERTQDNKVEISWSTASEYYSDYYHVERSANGYDFEVIGQVDAAGQSTSKLDYRFADNDPLENVSYYRLTQYDMDGNSETYPMKAINRINDAELTIYPNPVNRGEFVVIDGEQSFQSFDILDQTGRVLAADLKSNMVEMDHPSGIYFIHINYPNIGVVVKKIVVE